MNIRACGSAALEVCVRVDEYCSHEFLTFIKGISCNAGVVDGKFDCTGLPTGSDGFTGDDGSVILCMNMRRQWLGQLRAIQDRPGKRYWLYLDALV